MSKTVICFGELLWDLLPAGPELGGAPSNFAYRLHSLGHNAIIVSRVGTDDLGRKALEWLAEKGLNTDFIQVDPAHPTGTVEVTVNANGEPDYFIVPGVAYDQIAMTTQLADLASYADCVCFGALVQRSPTSRQTLSSLLAQTGGVKVLDINLRKNCYSIETIERSLERADILKLNEGELFELGGLLKIPAPARAMTGADSLCALAQSVAWRFGLTVCIVTRGANGAIALRFEHTQQGPRHSHNTEICSVPGFQVPVVDTCGSGDAFTAGFMHKYLNGGRLQECCRYGNALGALVAQTRGGTAPVQARQIEKLLQENPA